MKLINMRHLVIGVAMLAAAGLALALTPREKISDHGPKLDLEVAIPKQFGEWRLDETIAPVRVAPDVQAKLDKIYSQTLSRTYVNAKGDRLMLSIAYGSDQSDAMAVHKPEVCYPSQGFGIIFQQDGAISLSGKAVSVRHLVAKNGLRVEPITYWIATAGEVSVGSFERKLAKLIYTVNGKVPDGVLVRVSNLGNDYQVSFALHESFFASLLGNVSPDVREKLIGALVSG